MNGLMSMNDVHAPEKVRCPACGGLNAADAPWCGQCLKRFDAPAPPPPPPAPAVLAAGATGASAPPPPPVDGIKPGVEHGSFRSTAEGILWRCSACETENPLEEMSCQVCGKAFAEAVKPPSKPRLERDPGTVAMVSLFFPGAGHAYLGMWAQAIARGVVSVWAGLMTLFFAIGGSGGSLGVAALFGLVTFALWVVAAHDAFREASDEPRQVLLHGRRFTYVVLGLLMMLLASMFITALSNR